jgi:hypothetical protein
MPLDVLLAGDERAHAPALIFGQFSSVYLRHGPLLQLERAATDTNRSVKVARPAGCDEHNARVDYVKGCHD